MKEYIASLEKEFSLIENGFKEEEKRAFADYKSNDNEHSKKMAFLAYNPMYIKLECTVYFFLDTYQNKMIF